MNGKQLKRREPTTQKSSMSPPMSHKYPHDRRYVMGKGILLCAVAFVLIFAASGHSGRLIGSAYPLLDSHPGQFAAYFFAGFAGICGLDLIRKS